MLERLKTFSRFNPCLLLSGVVSLFLGVGWHGERPQIALDPEKVVEVRGWICRPPEVLEDRIHVELSPLEITQTGKSISYPGCLRVDVSSSLGQPETQFDPPLAYGEVLELTCFLEDHPAYAIPGVPDFRQILWQQGILHVVHLKSPLQISRRGSHSWTPLARPLFGYAQAFEKFCKKIFTPGALKLIRSLFLGHKKVLEDTDFSLLKNLGIFHIFVVSGFHVSVLLVFLHFLFQRFGILGNLLVLAGVWAYVVLVGWGVPAVRAAIMVTLFYSLLSFGLCRQLLNALGLSALIVLTFSPEALFSPGFQFSYLCLLVIGLFVLPREAGIRSLSQGFQDAFTERVLVLREGHSALRRRVRFWLEEKMAFWPPLSRCLLRPAGWIVAYLLGLALCGWFIQILTLPLSLFYTNRWIWAQWLNNLILVPCFTLLIPLCLFLFFTYWLPGAGIIAAGVEMYAGGLSWLMLAAENFAWVSYLPQPSSGEMIAYWLLFLSAYWFLPGRLKLSAFATPVFLWLVLRPAAPAPSPELSLTMLDIGQGESIHIRYPDGQDALVDTGGFLNSRGTGDSFVGERLISRYLWKRRSNGLNYILLTHPHADHVQGYNFLREAFSIERVFFYDFPDTGPGPPRQRLQEGDRFVIGGVSHRVLHPPDPRLFKGSWSTNDASLVVEMTYGQFRALLTGDIEEAAERHLLPRLNPVTVLKAAHHGGRTSNTAGLLERTRPQVALVSAGRNSLFGHPHPQTLERFATAGIPVLSTPQWGTLRIETDGLSWRLLHYSMEEKSFREIPLARK